MQTVISHFANSSVEGARQLASDLGYLSSVVMALNVEDEGLDRWKEWVEMGDVVGRERYKEEVGSGSGSSSGSGCRIKVIRLG